MEKKRVYCVDCEAEVLATIKEKEESYMVKGDGPFTITAMVPVCPRCGAELFDRETENQNQHKLYEKYREKHNLLSPGAIRTIREKYGLSQKSFSRLLGFGEITIHRYESGSIQDRVHDSIIRKASNPRFVKERYDSNPKAVSARERKTFEKRLETLLQEEDLEGDPLQRRKFLKAAAVLLFFATQVQDLYRTKACKLMWYADMLHFKEFGTSITGLQYWKYHYGPVPPSFDELLLRAKRENVVDLEYQTLDFPGCDEEVVTTKILPKGQLDRSLFSQSELEVLQFVVQKLGKYSSRKISEISHQEKAYQDAEDFKYIPYELARCLSLSLPKKTIPAKCS